MGVRERLQQAGGDRVVPVEAVIGVSKTDEDVGAVPVVGEMEREYRGTDVREPQRVSTAAPEPLVLKERALFFNKSGAY